MSPPSSSTETKNHHHHRPHHYHHQPCPCRCCPHLPSTIFSAYSPQAPPRHLPGFPEFAILKHEYMYVYHLNGSKTTIFVSVSQRRVAWCGGGCCQSWGFTSQLPFGWWCGFPKRDHFFYKMTKNYGVRLDDPIKGK